MGDSTRFYVSVRVNDVKSGKLAGTGMKKFKLTAVAPGLKRLGQTRRVVFRSDERIGDDRRPPSRTIDRHCTAAAFLDFF